MKLEIHKAGAKSQDVHIDISEVFPDHYDKATMLPVCEDEARALYDALKNALPVETRIELIRLFGREKDPS
jgi:hypothetical protein